MGDSDRKILAQKDFDKALVSRIAVSLVRRPGDLKQDLSWIAGVIQVRMMVNWC